MLMVSETGGLWQVWPIIKIVLLVIMAICAIFIIAVVLFQPGNSSGISALGGTTETYLSKNKGKTFEHKMKVMTVVSGIVFAVLCIVFAIIATL
jgi:preprotein translocase subunit SecG